MGGIVGFIDVKASKEKNKILLEMLEKIKHRGPNRIIKYIDGHIALGSRQLDLVGEINSDNIINENGNLIIVGNGRIYNYEELKDELSKKGHIFKTNNEFEVVLHGVEEQGELFVKRLRGMFTFVIWNKVNKELFGARDQFGIKPFYYIDCEDLFMFGSEIKSFSPHPNFIKELNKEALKPYLTFQYSVLNETFFKNVYKLDPGHYFIYKNNKLKIKKYYEIEFKQEEQSLDECISNINKLMKETVECYKESPVAIGSFLSGGIDSSYITKLSMPAKTFSVGFENNGFNEVNEAKELSKILKIENIDQIITADMFFDKLENIQYFSDEPHANLSAVPLYFLSELAKKHVDVILSGEGADELFAGYSTYVVRKKDESYRKIPMSIRKIIGNVANNLPRFRGRQFLINNGLNLEDYYIGQAYIFSEKEANKILKDQYKKSKSINQIVYPFFKKVEDLDEITKKQYLDMHLWLPQDILLKADKMTMAHSLEVRMPFLDIKVMDLASKIPNNYKIIDNITKYPLRQSANNELPEEWVKRPKLGFPVPFYHWIREEKYCEKIKEIFKQEYVGVFFNQKQILKLLEEHYQCQKNNGRKIWTIYAFLIWYKVYFIDENEK